LETQTPKTIEEKKMNEKSTLSFWLLVANAILGVMLAISVHQNNVLVNKYSNAVSLAERAVEQSKEWEKMYVAEKARRLMIQDNNKGENK
jgi:uncharacterized protein HemX